MTNTCFTKDDLDVIDNLTEDREFWFNEDTYIVHPCGDKIFRAVGLYYLHYINGDISCHISLEKTLDEWEIPS